MGREIPSSRATSALLRRRSRYWRNSTRCSLPCIAGSPIADRGASLECAKFDRHICANYARRRHTGNDSTSEMPQVKKRNTALSCINHHSDLRLAIRTRQGLRSNCLTIVVQRCGVPMQARCRWSTFRTKIKIAFQRGQGCMAYAGSHAMSEVEKRVREFYETYGWVRSDKGPGTRRSISPV